MAETDQKLVRLSEDQIVRRFRDALVALYPILNDLAIMEDQQCPYDDYDDLADSLWDVLVRRSLAWKHGLEASPDIQRYGGTRSDMAGGYIAVIDRLTGAEHFFNDFVGWPPQADPPFNIVRATDASGADIELPYGPNLEFCWRRP